MERSGAGDVVPHLLLVGEDEGLDAVAPSLRGLRVELRESRDINHLKEWSEEDCLGVILVDLKTSKRPWVGIEATRATSTLPVFAVISDESSGARIRRCYDAAASGVFEWPREAASLERYLAEMLATRLARGPARKPDIALARAVRSRLRSVPGLVEVPRLEVREGFVWASGTVDSLPLKLEMEECIAKVPGVGGVDTSGLHVVPDPVPDKEIRQTCRRLVRRSEQIDERTVSFFVDAGHLVFTGSAEDRQELRRLAKVAANIRGVRHVEVDVVASRHRRKPDRRAASRLERIVREVFPGGKVNLSLFGGVAVLDGTVHNLRTKQAIEAFVEEDALVERVVNKLEMNP